MKKLLVAAAISLLCFLAHSQEAEVLGGNFAEFSVIARGEYLHTDPLGNSSIYTLLEGSISEKLTYSVANHWLSSDPASLYQNTFRSDDLNWLDWAYLTYNVGDFAISAGKMCVLWGTYEFDEYDFDIHYPFASSVWNNLAPYQWGASVAWSPAEGLSLESALLSSPYGEHPFSSGLYNFGLRARAETEEVGAMIAYNVYNREDEQAMGVFSCGMKYSIGDFTFTVDETARICDENFIFMKGNSTLVSANYTGLEGFDLIAHLGADTYADNNGFYRAGLLVHYYPTDSIRLHAIASINSNTWDSAVDPLFGLGITYTFSTLWGK